MSTRDEPNLSETEQALFAELESAAAADDPGLSRRLRSTRPLRYRRHANRQPWGRAAFGGLVLVLAGLALIYVGLLSSLALSFVGVLTTAAGLGLVAKAVGLRFFPGQELSEN